MTAWDVRYARQFGEQLIGLPDPVYDRVEASIDASSVKQTCPLARL